MVIFGLQINKGAQPVNEHGLRYLELAVRTRFAGQAFVERLVLLYSGILRW